MFLRSFSTIQLQLWEPFNKTTAALNIWNYGIHLNRGWVSTTQMHKNHICSVFVTSCVCVHVFIVWMLCLVLLLLRVQVTVENRISFRFGYWVGSREGWDMEVVPSINKDQMTLCLSVSLDDSLTSTGRADRELSAMMYLQTDTWTVRQVNG